ncbi:MAG: DUF881 domain-containing protein [Actinomycetaceae bacterium]|nr:DUF881 domain-containing protein [Actinomycetaceae bacterium]
MSAQKPEAQHRLRDLVTSPVRPIHLVIGLLCLALGFALVTQMKLKRSDPLESLSEDELVTLLDQLTTSENQLRSERNELNAQIQKLQSSQSQAEAAREAAERDRMQAQILGGTTPVHGPGLTMTVLEGENGVRPQTFVTVIGELRNAGAEAIDLNGERITASTYVVRDRNGELLISGERVQSPYVWTIIGDADTIQAALEIARGATSQLRASGATVTFERSEFVAIDSIAQPMEYEYAIAQE